MAECACKKWTRAEQPFYAHLPSDHPKYHHPNCAQYVAPDVEDVREDLGRWVRGVIARLESDAAKNGVVTVWTDLGKTTWEELTEFERVALCHVGVVMAKIGQRIEAARCRTEMMEARRGHLPAILGWSEREFNAACLRADEAELAQAKAESERKTMAQTLTRAQSRGSELLERARRAEQQRDDALAEIARLLGERPVETKAAIRSGGEVVKMCTGPTASWCPVHGTCNCPRDTDTGSPLWDENGIVVDQGCPLHSEHSAHASPGREATACTCRACCGASGDDPCSCR